MLDAQFVADVFKTTSSLPNPTIPTSTPSSVPGIPTVVPAKPTYEIATGAGHKTLWVVFVIMFLSTLGFTFMAYRTPVQKRLYHVLTAFITALATLSYFAMATGGGVSFAHTVIHEAHKHVPDTTEHIFRQVYWARYVDWTVTTPLLLLDLSFLAGLNGANILVAVFADIVMVLTGLFAAFGKSEGTKWGWYAMACAAYLVIVWQLAIPGRRAVKSRDSATTKLFVSLATFTFVLWTMYPIVWGFADGARLWSVNTEIIAYAVLDVLAKPVFGFWLLFAHGKKAESIEGFWAHGLGHEGSIRIEDDEGA